MRIDEGVDYSGHGPVYALGPGTIENVAPSGWPGLSFIDERLSAGPYAGKDVYAAENIAPAVHVGQKVTKNTIIGTLQSGYPYSEFGFGGQGPSGGTLSQQLGQGADQQTGGLYSSDPGAHTTAAGLAFARLLHALGAPFGIRTGSTVVGQVPAGYLLPVPPHRNAATPTRKLNNLAGIQPGHTQVNPPQSGLLPTVGGITGGKPRGKAVPTRPAIHHPAGAAPYHVVSSISSTRHGRPVPTVSHAEQGKKFVGRF